MANLERRGIVRNSLRYALAAWVGLAVAGSAAKAQTEVSFTDTTFAVSDYTTTIIVNEVGSSARVTVRQRGADGNPGLYRRVMHEGDKGAEAHEMQVAHLHREATHDPAVSGGIATLSYGYDLRTFESAGFSNYYLVIFQNDSHYRPRIDRVSREEWTRFGRSGLTARSFSRVRGTGPRQPDFSAAGSLLQFGFVSVSKFAQQGEVEPGSNNPDDKDSRTTGVDNWSVNFTTVSATPTLTTDATLPNGTVGGPYMARLSASGGSAPLSWATGGGALPPGLSLNPSTAAISGTPIVPGVFPWVALVTDQAGVSAAKAFTIQINADPGQEAGLAARPNRLLFSYVQGSPAETKKLFILNEGPGSLSFQAEFSTQSGGPWLMVSPVAGQATAVDPPSLDVTADPAGAPAGTYFGEIRIVGTSGQVLTVPAVMAISSRRQLLRLSQTGLQFTAVSGGPDVPVQNIQVLNGGLGVMGWNIGVSTLSGGSWLGVNPLEGASAPSDPATVDVRVNPRGLAPGPYYGLAEVAAPVAANSPQLTTVVLNVLLPGGAPGPIIRPLGLFFAAEPGGAAPPPQAVDIFNVTSQPMSFALQAVTLNGIGWLGPAMAEGTAAPGGPTAIGVEVDASELGTGIHRGLLRFVFDGTLARTVEVVLAVAPGAAAALKPPDRISQDRISQEGCSRTEIAPVFKVLGSTTPISAGWPASIEVEVADNCATKMTEGSVVVEFANIASTSLALVHTSSGLWTDTWNVPSSVDADSMAVATVTATDFAGIKGAVSQALAVSPNPSPPPQVAPGGVVHSASFVLDPLAPGTIVSIFGSNLSSEPVSGGRSASGIPLSTELAGTQLILGGRPLPILFSREDQVNAVLPFEVADRLNESLPLLARRTDAASLSVSAPVLVTAARPGVFTQNRSGSGAGVIQNANSQIVTPANPVKAGDAIIIYGAGLGGVSPGVTSGDPAPSSPLARTAEDVTVTIGGRSAQVFFAGLSPFFASLYQVNAFVPAGVPAGDAEVVVSIAGQASPVVTLAVE